MNENPYPRKDEDIIKIDIDNDGNYLDIGEISNNFIKLMPNSFFR